MDEFEKWWSGKAWEHEDLINKPAFRQVFKAGREAGMREAIVKAEEERLISADELCEADKAYNMAIKHCTDAILSAIDAKEPKS